VRDRLIACRYTVGLLCMCVLKVQFCSIDTVTMFRPLEIKVYSFITWERIVHKTVRAFVKRMMHFFFLLPQK